MLHLLIFVYLMRLVNVLESTFWALLQIPISLFPAFVCLSERMRRYINFLHLFNLVIYISTTYEQNDFLHFDF